MINVFVTSGSYITQSVCSHAPRDSMLKLIKYALSVLSLVLSVQILLIDVSRVFKDILLTQKQTPVQLPMIANLDNIKIHMEDV